jgi:hypothetical protein
MTDKAAIFRVRQTPLRDLFPRIVAPPAKHGPVPARPAMNASRVCDLLDSMYLGYPITHVAVLKTRHPEPYGQPGGAGALLVLDGEAMLAGLAGAMLGQAPPGIARAVIAFYPTTETFLVSANDCHSDPACIPDIAAFMNAGASRYRLATDYLLRLAAAAPLSERLKETLSLRIDRLISLAGYPVTVFEFPSGVPSQRAHDAAARLAGTRLGLTQEDLALAETGCRRPALVEDLYRFCRLCRRPPEAGEASPFNHILRPSPRDLVMAALSGRAVTAARACRGLCDRLGMVLDLVCWHGFLTALAKAGFRGAMLIGSRRAAYEAYGGYLALKRRAVSAARRDRLSGLLYLGLCLNPAVLGKELERREADAQDGPSDYPELLEESLAAALDDRFFSQRLPALLAKPGIKTTAFLAYLAAQARLGAPVLFSQTRVGDLLDYGFSSGKKALERHHLHPRNHLHSRGVRDNARIDRPGNLALVEWTDNSAIADLAPQRYVPELRGRFTKKTWERMLSHNALWPDFEQEPYETFLAKRETLMAALIRQAYLGG